MGRRGERGSLELLRRPQKYFCWTSCWASAFAFCPPPVAVHFIPYRNFLPPFRFLVASFLFLPRPLFPRLSLHLVSLPPCSLTFLGLLPFVTYVHVLSHRTHFPRFLLPISSPKIFLVFPPSRSISLPLPFPLFLPFSPSSQLLAPLTIVLTPLFLPYLAGHVDPSTRTHLLTLLEELHAFRAPRIITGMRTQEIPG